ncbi:tocopherol cyclase family protein [Anaerocolumna sp. MB42-C2]|uniref:tocopherol cyclase family protein n=1 Tax=Anaerocolumna sp. MB42-C2 TaxID=3070997 RepID=UPI0027E04D9B|nr:tocopherol cyclase family protein [Anaerocolumna sp. MB42-C2]WMJ90475.1 tocopherol cyclase family protein [Anaerocolumna sp. MB42-C2]
MKHLINYVYKKSFFEGWYFKCQKGDQIISFIPSYSTDKNGISRVFLQIIMNDNSYIIPYKPEDFYLNRKYLFIRIGNNSFSRKGIKIDIHTEKITINGILYFGKMEPLPYTIMGYFHYFPGMECKHEIISMYHKIKGSLKYNKREYNFNSGSGYLEKDMGHSFPKSYTWIQCNHFPAEKCSVFISIAEIPYHGIHFKGCICAIHYKGKEYRFATYLGVKVLKSTCNEICLKQGKYLFKVKLYNNKRKNTKYNPEFSHKLAAPVLGDMSKTIKEQHLIAGEFLLYEKSNLILHLTSRHVSFEFVE